MQLYHSFIAVLDWLIGEKSVFLLTLNNILFSVPNANLSGVMIFLYED